MSAKVARAVRDVVEHAKTVASQNIATAIAQGLIKDAPVQEVEKIMSIVRSSIDQAYHESAKSVDKAIAATVGDTSKKNV